MSAFGALSAAGMGGGYSASSGANVSNTNRSVNIVGPSGGGSAYGLGELLAYASGSNQNGGFTSGIVGDTNVGGLIRRSPSLLDNPLLLLGGMGLIALVLWKKL